MQALASFAVQSSTGKNLFVQVLASFAVQSRTGKYLFVILALQPLATPSSVSLLIPLQTLLFRTPTDAALRWASEFLHFPPFPPCF